MELAGLVGKLLSGWGVVGFILASVTHDRGYPAATWLLVYLGLVLFTVGAVLWWRTDLAEEAARPPARDDWTDQ
jgi:hypothetical protein